MRKPPPTPQRLHLRVLGPVVARLGDDPLATTRLTQPRHLALLAYLVLARPRGLHARDTLIALLWPDHDDARGRQALRNALHGIRRRLGHDVIVSAGEGLVGVNPALASCDALDLERGLLPADDLRRAEPFQGFHVAGAAAFDHWLSREQARLRGLLAALEARPGAVRAPDLAAPVAREGVHRHDAYALYGRGHYLFLRAAHSGAVGDLQRSRDYFERALALDPTYGAALAGLANFYAVAARREVLRPFRETFATAIAYSHRALAIDASLAIPHVHFGVQALYLDRQFEAAGREFACAVSKEPQYAEGQRFLGVWLGLAGRHDEALAAMETAARLEPDIPHMLSSLGAARLAVGDVAGAEEALRSTLVLDAGHGPARERLLRLLEDADRWAEALAVRRAGAASFRGEAFDAAWRADGAEGYRRLLREAWRQRAEALEAGLIRGDPPSVSDIFAPPVLQLVACLALLGERRKAQAWRLQACAERPILAHWFRALPEARLL